MREQLLERGPRLRRAILLGGVFGVPVIFLRQLSDPINVPKLALLAAVVVAAGAVALAEISQGRAAKNLQLLAVPALAAVIPLLVAWALSPYREWALLGDYARFLGLVPYVVVVLFAVLVADAFAGQPLALCWALLAGGGVCAGYALIQAAGLDPLTWLDTSGEAERVVSSTMGNSNFVGSFLAITLPAGLMLLKDDSRRRLAVGAVVAVIVGGWVVASSEAAWGAGIAGLGATASVIWGPRAGSLRKVAMALVALVAVVAVASVLAFVFDVDAVENGALPETLDRRAQWWEASVHMAADSPLVGQGPNAFAIEHSRYRTADDAFAVNFDITDDPHNVFLSSLTSAGLFGAIGYLVFCSWIVRNGVRLEAKNRAGAAFFGCAIAYLIQSLVSIDTVGLRTAGWTAVAGLAASEVVGERKKATARERKRAKTLPLQRLPALAVVIIVAIFCSVWVVRFVGADAHFLQGQVLLEDGDANQAIDRFQAARTMREDVVYRRALGNLLGDLAVSLGSQQQFEPARLFLDESRDAFAYTEDVPDSNSIVDQARVFAAFSEFEERSRADALRLYERALELDPKNLELVEEAAAAAISFEEWERALAFLEPALGLFDEYRRADLWGLTALGRAHTEEISGAREAIAAARSINPDEENADRAEGLLSDGASP